MPPCSHATLKLTPSPFATAAGYKQPTPQALEAATQLSGRPSADEPVLSASTFPAPLVLPGDELAWNPRSSPQSVRSWRSGPFRNIVTPKRNKIYVVLPPQIAHEAGFVEAWAQPNLDSSESPKKPGIEDIVEYCEAFFSGLTCHVLHNSHLTFRTWDDDEGVSHNKKRRRQLRRSSTNLALQTDASTAIRIRTRATKESLFSHQLNLNDLLDVAIEILPSDAYALLMLIDHDLYEDEEDDFCCGRAYGGSRVCVVSSARYNPMLDEVQGVEREHTWPASHCVVYMNRVCRGFGTSRRQKAQSTVSKKSRNAGALGAAVVASLKPGNDDDAHLSTLWLARVCKTASHELLHCLGLAHCVYYACVMQSTANIGEDARQPPYLCPVCEAKLFYATHEARQNSTKITIEDVQQEWIEQRCTRLARFCDKDIHAVEPSFRGLSAWCRSRLEPTCGKGVRGEPRLREVLPLVSNI